MMMSAADFDLLVRNRRSIFPKEYTGARVDDGIVTAMLENANWAPTHKLTEPWRFVVYTKDGLHVLARLQSDYYKEVTSRDGTYREEKYQGLLSKPLQSSHIVVIAVRRTPGNLLPVVEEIGAVYCAVQNMYLTATAHGVGVYLSTGGITYFEGAQRLFGFGEDDILVGFLHVGVPASVSRTGNRKPVADKTRWVTG